MFWDTSECPLIWPLCLGSRKNRVYDRKHSPTQPLTKITSYTLKRITFTTSRASEIKVRAKEALPINLYSEKYIRILQMLETQLKRNRKGNSSFYHSPLCFSSITPPCGHDSCYLPVLHTSRTWPCDAAPPPYFTFAYRLLWTSSGTTAIISYGLIISG